MAAAPMTTASASHYKTTHHKKKPKHSSGGSSLSGLNCPKQSLITSATGVTYTGPSKNNGGTAACIYSDATGNELNVIYDAPSESQKEFVSTDPGDIGEPAQAVHGLGKAAFSTTTLGHAEVDVYESSTKGFAVTLDPFNQAAVTPADLTQVVAVAHKLAG
jgi:hypothetical protein